VKVKGWMNSHNIYHACKRNGMKPVCNHRSYFDHKCKLLGGNHHFSYPPHVRRHHKLSNEKLKWAFFYAGRAHHQRSLLNTEHSHRWSRNNRDRDGDTFCVKDTGSSGTGSSLLSVGDTVALWNPIHKRFIRMHRHSRWCDASGHRHDGSLPSGWTWERFKVVQGPGNTVALWNPLFKRFLRMGHFSRLDKSGHRSDGKVPNGWTWEQFRVVNGPHNTVAFWSPRWKRFVRMHAHRYMDRSGHRGDGSLPHGWTWERFKVVVYKRGTSKQGSCRGSVMLAQHGSFNGRRAHFPKGKYTSSGLRSKGFRENMRRSIAR